MGSILTRMISESADAKEAYCYLKCLYALSKHIKLAPKVEANSELQGNTISELVRRIYPYYSLRANRLMLNSDEAALMVADRIIMVCDYTLRVQTMRDQGYSEEAYDDLNLFFRHQRIRGGRRLNDDDSHISKQQNSCIEFEDAYKIMKKEVFDATLNSIYEVGRELLSTTFEDEDSEAKKHLEHIILNPHKNKFIRKAVNLRRNVLPSVCMILDSFEDMLFTVMNNYYADFYNGYIYVADCLKSCFEASSKLSEAIRISMLSHVAK